MSSTKEKKRTSDTEQQVSKKQKTEDGKSDTDSTQKFLSSVNAFIMPASIEKIRLQIFETNLCKFGGSVCKKLDENVTHLIVDDKMESDRMCRILKVDIPPDSVLIVKSNWLSLCFREKRLLDCTDYLLDLPKPHSVNEKEENNIEDNDNIKDQSGGKPETETKTTLPKVGMMFGHKAKTTPKPEPAGESDSDYCPSDGGGAAGGSGSDSDVERDASSSTIPLPNKILPRGNWVCAQSSKVQVENHNKHITDKLEEMVRTYESTNDKWRAFGYQKAIQVLRKQPKPITSFEEAKALPQVGKRLAEKIWEIAESGELRKLNELKQSEDVKVIEMFKDVWGAGALTARTWYQQGFRTLEDLRTKANLTYQQKIGLKHYDDILDRMPWSEAGEIEQVVRMAAESLQDGVIAQACGSYRRKKATCGDVDVLVTHPDGKSHKGMFSKLLTKLKEQESSILMKVYEELDD